MLHTALALWSLITGAFLCATYDIFRLMRTFKRQGAVTLFISDFVFCLFSAVCLLILFFNLSYGRVRLYALALAVGGFLLWRFTVSRLVMALLLKLIKRVNKLLISIKMRVSVKSKRLSRRIYTKRYCKKAIRKVYSKGL